MKKNLKPLLLISGLLSLLIGLIAILASIVIFLASFVNIDAADFIMSLGFSFFLNIILAFIVFGVALTLFIMSIFLLINSNKNYGLLKSRKASMIGYIVVAIFFMLMCGVMTLILAENSYAIIPLILIGLIVICLVLVCIQLGLINRYISKERIEFEKSVPSGKIDLSKLNSKLFMKQEKTEEQLKQELEKLEECKNRNIISEEEYKRLRESIINDTIKKH